MSNKGFSLVELMIVIAIMVFLTMISMPTFISFLAKAKRTEAYVNLHAIYAAEKAYWIEHGTYSSNLQGLNGIGWKPEGYQGGGEKEVFNYTYGFPGIEGTNYVTGKLATPSVHVSIGYADKNGFVAVAAGDIDNDGEPDILTINERNIITIVKDDLNK